MTEPAVPRKRPSVLQRQIGFGLLSWRTRAGRTQKEVADLLRWPNPNKVARIELGHTAADVATISGLALVLGVDEDERDQMIRKAENAAAEKPGWWRAYGGTVPEHVREYVNTERQAVVICSVVSLLVPGLLQTAAYTARLIRDNVDDDAVIQERVELRRLRQERLDDQPRPLRFRTLIDEAVLHRPVDSPHTMLGQITHLLDCASWPNIDLRILPVELGSYPGMGATYDLFKFDNENDDWAAVYLENLYDGIWVEALDDVPRYARHFERLSTQALDTTSSMQRLDQVRDAWMAQTKGMSVR